MQIKQEVKMERVVTAIASPNIAFVKFWGRRNEVLNLPHNPSVSMTLDAHMISTTTSIVFSGCFKKDLLYINGRSHEFEDSANEILANTHAVLDTLRGIAGTEARALVVSENSFPSDAGIASSASGAAAFVQAAAEALGLDLTQKEMTIMGRNICGSGGRSLVGGFVLWHMGVLADGSDSFSEQIASQSHWPEMVDVIAIVDRKAKKVSSPEGLRRTWRTSTLYEGRPGFAEEGVRRLLRAIPQKDFDTVAEVIMRDSNNMHATALDAWPPIFYMTDVSKTIVYAVHEMNDASGKYIAAYTFDAGANAHIITTRENVNTVVEMLRKIEGVDDVIAAGVGEGPRIEDDMQKVLISQELTPIIRERIR